MNNFEYPEQDDISGVKRRNTPVFGVGDSALQAAGGEEGVTQLVRDFYHYIDTLPDAAVIRAMYDQDLTLAQAKLTTFLIGWLGGVNRYTELYGPFKFSHAHQHLRIGQAEKKAWLLCMQKAVDDQPYDELFKRFIMVQLSFPAEMCRNHK